MRRLPLLLAGLVLLGGCDDDPVDPDPACRDATTLQMGITRDSVLGPGDPLLDDAFVNYYAILPEVAGTLVVEMAAEIPIGGGGIDPFLYLWTENLGPPIAQGYDPTGEGPLLRIARLTAEVVPGCYRLGASGWPGYSTGVYTLRAELDPAGQTP